MTRTNDHEQFLGIDIGSSSIKVVRFSAGENDLRLTHHECVSFPKPAISRDGVIDRAAIVDALRSMNPRLTWNPRYDHVCVAIPGVLTTTRFAAIPELSNQEFRKHLQSEAQTYCDPESFIFAAKLIGERPRIRGNPQRASKSKMVFLIMAERSILDTFWGIMEDAGIPNPNFSVDALGTTKAYENSIGRLGSPGGVTGIIHIGAQTASISSVREGGLIFIRSMVNDPTKDLARNTGQEARRSYDYFREQSKVEKLDRILVSGAPACDEEFRNNLSEGLGWPVVLGNPLESIVPAAVAGVQEIENAPRFAVAIGMGMIAHQAWFSGMFEAGLF